MRICLLLLFFSNLNLAVGDVFQSNNESADRISFQKYFANAQEISSGKGRNKEPSHVTKQNVLDNLCRFHSDFPFFYSLGSVSNNLANLQVQHDLFDTSFGLVPHISYNGECQTFSFFVIKFLVVT